MVNGTTRGAGDLHALRGTLDPLPIGVILLDPCGKPRVANRAARELLGPLATLPLDQWAADGTLLKPGGLPAGVEDLPPLQTLEDGASRCEVELCVADQSEGLLPLLMSSRAVRDPEGDVMQVAVSLTPIARHVRRGRDDRLAQRYEAIGTLLGSVAGPLNDALTAVEGYCDIASSRLSVGDPVAGVVEEIRHAGARAAALTGRLLAHAKREVAAPRVLDVDRWLATHVTALRSVLGDEIVLEVAPGAPAACAFVDPRLLEQVLSELLANARAAMPGGGLVRVRTRAEEPDPAFAASAGEALASSTVCVTVEDKGGGIADPVLRRIFDPFFSTRPGSLGLGLATVDRIVRAQGGYVRVENRRNEGVAFHVHLARVADNSREEEVPLARADRQSGSSVLVVEDDGVVRDLVRMVLELDGLKVHEARGGAEASRLADSWPRDERGPDLLITDLVLPGMDGAHIARRIRERWPDIGVLLVSGCNDASVVGTALTAAQGTAFLPKPFAPGALLANVRRLLPEIAEAEAAVATLPPSA